jgi:hypothetical protein
MSSRLEARMAFIFGASDECIKQVAEDEQRLQEALNDQFLDL